MKHLTIGFSSFFAYCGCYFFLLHCFVDSLTTLFCSACFRFKDHVAYSMAKYGMSLCVLGHSAEFKEDGIAVNALWPRTTIATAAIQNLLGGDVLSAMSRTPDIMGDAAHAILTRKSRKCTGNFFVDDEVLASEGVTDFEQYNFTQGMLQSQLAPDFFV
eukprot:m.56953 g.56953  ORF g.56953 m.56953 type:complete len:159 (+) comp11580_c1_seq1:881-1357(+)